MKTAILGALVLLAMSLSVHADTVQQAACKAEITAKVKAAAKLVGINDEIGFEVNPTGNKTQTAFYEPLDEYATSAFEIEEGYLTGSGAIVEVKSNAASCEVVRLNVSAR